MSAVVTMNTTVPHDSTPTPQATLEQFTRFLLKRSADGLASLYEEDALLISPTGEPARGRSAIRTSFEGMLAIQPTLELTVHEAHVAGDLAFVANDWVMRGVSPDGTRIESTGRSAVVLRRQRDLRWLIALDRP